MMRAMAMNSCQLVSFDQSKEFMKKQMPPDTSSKQIAIQASFISSMFVSVGVLPFDNVKTKLQNQKVQADGTKLYKNIPDCFKKTISMEGASGLWAGLPTFYFRVGPHTILTLLASEFLRNTFTKKNN